LEGDLSGFLYRDKGQAVIGVNTRHHPVRQNFTIGHELGHFFAASLLMPREFLEADLEKEDYVDLLDGEFLRGLSRKYGVSTQALVNRLKNLGYIQE
jgi:Zn-dependent peptidase ImmA (M78 family)